MTRDQIQTALNEGTPSEIRMADGATHRVTERCEIDLRKASVVVFDPKDLFPLVTITGLTHLKGIRKV